MRKRWIVTAIVVAIAACIYLLLPHAPVQLAQTVGANPAVRGAIHVHTRRSDGTGTVQEIAAAAKRAGLSFVIFTDHGDGTRGSDTPAYYSGVLCIDAVEISTRGGHVVALDLPQSPYPLAGHVADVLEDVRRMGGMAIAAHPDSARLELEWRDWTAVPDGLEWLNGDSAWRDEGWGSLSRTMFTYPFRRAATLGTLLDRPDALLNRWDSLLQERDVVAVAAVDAHARVGPGGDPYGRSVSLHLPSYEQVFRTLSISVPVQLQGDARSDARAVVDAIRGGRSYSTVDALATPSSLSFSAASGRHRATMGGHLPLSDQVEIDVRASAPPGAAIRLLSDGRTVSSASAQELKFTAPRMPGVYRVEVDLPGAPGSPPVPWIVSNPIYVGVVREPHTPAQVPAVSEVRPVYTDGPVTGWTVETSARSQGTIGIAPTVGGTQVLLRFGLGGTLSESPYVAAVVAVASEIDRFDGVRFTARAMQPMRVTFQVRAPGPADRRWGKSFYVDETPRTVTLAFDHMTPLGEATGAPALAEVRDALFVVDTVHTKQGASGQVWLDDISYVRE